MVDAPRAQVALGVECAATAAVCRRAAAGGGLELVGQTTTAAGVLELVVRTGPDVVIVAASLAVADGGRLLEQLRVSRPARRTLALVDAADERQALAAVLGGARGLLDEAAPSPRVADAVRRVARGELVLEGEAGERVLARVRTELATQLSAQGRDVLDRPELERLLSGEALAIALQPICDLATGSVLGYEALSRFALEPPRPPDRVFATAARLGRGVELELVAIDHALALLPRLPAGTYLGINASPDTALSPLLHDRLATHPGVARILLEITENAPIENYDAFSAALAPLRARGLQLAIDDAGAGFASMRHILRLDPDVIKLDRSITERVDRDRSARALAAALALFAIESGMGVVAEGIETSSQLAVLQALGVSIGQGYLLGRPAVPEPRAERGT